MADLVIISNRLPVSVRKTGKSIEVYLSSGGLARGLMGYTRRRGTKWIGWPGLPSDDLTEEDKRIITEKLKAKHCYPVFLTKKQVDDYYNGYSNSVLWPQFHNLQVRTGDSAKNWQAYQAVNRQFTEVALELSKPGDTLWVHDYQLLLVPQYLRAERPEDHIGYFLHIPFPAADVFTANKHAGSLLAGVLGADLVGLHTSGYAQNFLQSCKQLEFGTIAGDKVLLPARAVHVSEFPMGIDYLKFAHASGQRHVKTERRKLERAHRGRKIIATVDRLDPAKGLVERLKAFEQLLETSPQLHGKVTMIMLVIPSREEIATYQQLKMRMEKIVQRINNRYGNETWEPVEYMYRSMEFAELVALYQRADVAFIAPLRDGMNLVAKEYLASQQHRDGVLVLSKTAGAADELKDAIRVDPAQPPTLVRGLSRALALPKKDLRRRTSVMRQHLKHHTVDRWADTFMKELQRPHAARLPITRALDASNRKKLLDAYSSAAHRLLLLDYDGVLRSFTRDPTAAIPSPELLRLLRRLGNNKANDIVIVSGRDKSNLTEWFGKLPIALAAEHGAVFRRKGGKNWHKVTSGDTEWRHPTSVLFRHYADKTPGAFVEQKEWAIVWHYRTASPYYAQKHLVALRRELKPLTKAYGIQVIEGHKVLEVRPSDVSKGRVSQEWLIHDYDFVLAVGDDTTDEDMFAALPPGAYSIKVGHGATYARFRLSDVTAVLGLLSKF